MLFDASASHSAHLSIADWVHRTCKFLVLFRSICSGFGILNVFAFKCNVAFCDLLHDVETKQNLKTLSER